VRVEGQAIGDQVHVSIWDEGPGVPEASRGRMFERFYRSQAANAPGLGLGLYITRSLVEMLGGSVAAENRADETSGLIVTVVLPIRERS
jgi:K+-sensing histidine kinase KdpD